MAPRCTQGLRPKTGMSGRPFFRGFPGGGLHTAHLGSLSWPALACLGTLLGPSWPHLGAVWARFGPSWRPLGPILASSRRHLGSRRLRKIRFLTFCILSLRWGAQDGSQMAEESVKMIPDRPKIVFRLPEIGPRWTKKGP